MFSLGAAGAAHSLIRRRPKGRDDLLGVGEIGPHDFAKVRLGAAVEVADSAVVGRAVIEAPGLLLAARREDAALRMVLGLPTEVDFRGPKIEPEFIVAEGHVEEVPLPLHIRRVAVLVFRDFVFVVHGHPRLHLVLHLGTGVVLKSCRHGGP